MFKTILVHVDLSSHAPARMRYAAALAHAHHAHLLGAAMFGVSHNIFPQGYAARPGTLEASYFDPLEQNARRALAQFEAIASEMRVPHEGRFVCDQADDGLARLARFADLVVLSQDDPDEALPDLAVHLPDYVILNSPRPVLVLPRTDVAPGAARDVLIAWDGGKEAARALTAALPLLHRASAVTIAALTGPDAGAAELESQRPDLLRFFGHHGVTPHMLVRDPRRDPGHELLDLAAELHCGLLVMGCFGHSKLRELCLGGASRAVLADARIPVLLAH
ncbi:universal stress protein [Telluria mixta]|uniref:Universal stress protein n=1 Tax=Telluria mixta TaxID=34071 RepID=A0ABT2BSK0_9BURK|nr:universal stress protein [Telluria mixta]MCS0628090.1 universal stress protein [Telluria mixta]WEM93794.1 universal stress protein [Telluria mixta]